MGFRIDPAAVRRTARELADAASGLAGRARGTDLPAGVCPAGADLERGVGDVLGRALRLADTADLVADNVTAFLHEADALDGEIAVAWGVGTAAVDWDGAA